MRYITIDFIDDVYIICVMAQDKEIEYMRAEFKDKRPAAVYLFGLMSLYPYLFIAKTSRALFLTMCGV